MATTTKRLLIQESYENEDRGYIFGTSEWYEPYTDDLGRLFRSMQKEYGRCDSKIYVDKADGTTVPTGWHFTKRMEYEDSRTNETYIRGVWVTYRWEDVTDDDTED